LGARASAALALARRLDASVRRGLCPGSVRRGWREVLRSKLPPRDAGRRPPGRITEAQTGRRRSSSPKPFARGGGHSWSGHLVDRIASGQLGSRAVPREEETLRGRFVAAPPPGGSDGPSEARLRSGRARGAVHVTEAVRARVVRAQARRHDSRGHPAEGTQKRPAPPSERELQGPPWKARRATGAHFGRGSWGRFRWTELRGTQSRHPSRPEEKASQKADTAGSDRREPAPQQQGRHGSRGASRTDATSRRDEFVSSGNRAGGRVRAREPGAQRTPSGTRRHSSFAGSVVRGIGHVAFASDGLGKGRGRREVVLPLHPRRAEVDARAEASPNRASRGSPPWRSHRQEGVGRTRRAARRSHAP